MYIKEVLSSIKIPMLLLEATVMPIIYLQALSSEKVFMREKEMEWILVSEGTQHQFQPPSFGFSWPQDTYSPQYLGSKNLLLAQTYLGCVSRSISSWINVWKDVLVDVICVIFVGWHTRSNISTFFQLSIAVSSESKSLYLWLWSWFLECIYRYMFLFCLVFCLSSANNSGKVINFRSTNHTTTWKFTPRCYLTL